MELRRIFSGIYRFSVVAGFLASFVSVVFFRMLNMSILTTDVVVDIKPSMTATEIIDSLYDHGVILDKRYMLAFLKITRQDSKLKFGKYFFSAGLSQHDVIRLLLLGRSINYKMTIPEGLSTYQIVVHLLSYGLFEDDLMDQDESLDCLYMLPNTYYIPYNYTVSDILKLFCHAGDKVIQEIWDDFKDEVPGYIRDVNDLLVFASIIEKESYDHDEMPYVSSVFHNRMNRGMKLEADPTVVFAITDGTNILKRSLLRKDLAIEHEYNTYYIKGLPPTPICHPSVVAIDATIFPAQSNYLFFFSHNGEKHVFSEQFSEHIINIRSVS
ncbi:MAG: aminodeoxychorismate lyase family protein [Candidatus Xenolissoclinum pacificiensis L6]|uniref:Endolytic murein transglycosylase n=1 Tax=Candidatus Xenolissoclinum pacificiensis L6 TaxID=1401685 RepID=W2V1J8_9RICK|nr:MAG: aminodeoxychorismate lyase family protein [Candidatus Xenolissoclinum pacificiensis L6]